MFSFSIYLGILRKEKRKKKGLILVDINKANISLPKGKAVPVLCDFVDIH